MTGVMVDIRKGQSVQEAFQAGLDVYNKKDYPVPAQILMVNPSMELPDDFGLTVVTRNYVLPACLWIGYEENI